MMASLRPRWPRALRSSTSAVSSSMPRPATARAGRRRFGAVNRPAAPPVQKRHTKPICYGKSTENAQGAATPGAVRTEEHRPRAAREPQQQQALELRLSSHERCCHSDPPFCIPAVIIHTKLYITRGASHNASIAQGGCRLDEQRRPHEGLPLPVPPGRGQQSHSARRRSVVRTFRFIGGSPYKVYITTRCGV
jgi:hypothetical protein